MNQASAYRAIVVATALLIPGSFPALAQSPPPISSSPMAPQAPVNTSPAAPRSATNASPQGAAEQRIAAMKAQLQITDAQLTQWNALAQAMRDNATSTDALFRQRAGSAAAMNALDNMKSYALVARTYADNTQALATAFEALYGVLSEQQKQAVDNLFRQQSTQNAKAPAAR